MFGSVVSTIMSKKQTILHSFFQPKVKDFVLSSEPLHVKSWSYLKSSNKRNVNNNLDISPGNVISLLSSDEEEDDENDENKNIQEEINPANSSAKGLNIKSEDTNQVSSVGECSFNSLEDKSDEFVSTTDFLDVVLQEDGSFDTEKNALPEDPTDYKLSNFSSMIDWVLNDQSNLHLFNEDDWNVIENFKSLSGKNSFCFVNLQNYINISSVPSQRLYVRLYVRKHRWIRSSKISYPELGADLKLFFDELVHKRLLLPCNN